MLLVAAWALLCVDRTATIVMFHHYAPTPILHPPLTQPAQLEAVNWLLFNWSKQRNSLLADEMGLVRGEEVNIVVEVLLFFFKVFF